MDRGSYAKRLAVLLGISGYALCKRADVQGIAATGKGKAHRYTRE